MKRLLTRRSYFYNRVSLRTAENGDWTEKIRAPEDLSNEAAFQVFHMKRAEIDETNSTGMIKQ